MHDHTATVIHKLHHQKSQLGNRWPQWSFHSRGRRVDIEQQLKEHSPSKEPSHFHWKLAVAKFDFFCEGGGNQPTKNPNHKSRWYHCSFYTFIEDSFSWFYSTNNCKVCVYVHVISILKKTDFQINLLVPMQS